MHMNYFINKHNMIIIPMAGKSSRFYKAGYTLPKFMLPLKDKTIFEVALSSFKKYFETDFFLFIIRTDDGSEDFVLLKCSELNIKNFKIISINYDTRGQADTVKIGLDKSNVDLNEELYIFNIDSIRLNFIKPNISFLKNTAGYLEVFKGKGEHWSFVEPLKNNLVKRTTEKIKISDLCSNGLYYFRSVKLFKQIFTEFEEVNEYCEFFIAPMYNLLLKENFKVKYILLENKQTLFSGTPKEYESLKLNYIND